MGDDATQIQIRRDYERLVLSGVKRLTDDAGAAFVLRAPWLRLDDTAAASAALGFMSAEVYNFSFVDANEADLRDTAAFLGCLSDIY